MVHEQHATEVAELAILIRSETAPDNSSGGLPLKDRPAVLPSCIVAASNIVAARMIARELSGLESTTHDLRALLELGGATINVQGKVL